MGEQLPGNGFWGWLGRQIGHVKVAVKTDVHAPSNPALPHQPPAAPASPPRPPPGATTPPPSESGRPQVIYRDEKVEEVELPDRPGVVLRRTVIDEALVTTRPPADPPPRPGAPPEPGATH